MTHYMNDSVTPSNVLHVPADAYAGYVDGRYANVTTMHTFGKPVLDIAVRASTDATALDVEPGDATPAQAVAWVDRQHARGVAAPWVYCSRSDSAAVVRALGARRYILWIAHPSGVAHICTKARCGVPRDADATQFEFRSDIDRTAMTDAAFATIPGAPKAASAPAKANAAAPQGYSVKQLQSEMNRLFPAYSKLAVDGIAGPATTAVVREFQKRSGLTVDGIVGPQTLAALRKNRATV